MRFGSLQKSQRILARGAALVLVGGVAAGCSSGVSRFTDDILTGSTANQRSIVRKDSQPFPGDVAARPAPANGTYAESAARTAVAPQPVTRSSLPPVASAPVSTPAPTVVAEAPRVDTTPTGSVARTPVAQVEEVHQGWSRAGGTQVTLKEGETLYNLSKRFGVPVKEIMKANGIASADTVTVGQKVVIPTYVYSSKAPVSAPDNTREVAEAKSSRGVKTDAPADVPRPGKRPDNLAVLPQQPKVKEAEAETKTADNSAAPAAPKPTAQTGGGYTVVAGDSLYGIAKKTGAKAADIRKANNLGETANLKIGQKLVIPAAGQQVAQAPKVDPVITGTAGPAKKEAKPEAAKLATYTPPKADNKVIKDAEAASKEAAPDSTGIGKMRWPVRGRVVGTYGNSNGASFNDGIDIAVPEGTPVKAAENGVVIFAGEGLKDFGKTVLVRHADGKVTVYGHTGEIKVSRGDTVKRGQEIATSGMTGSTDTPKLHFEVRENSNPVDPQQYLE
ncbi:Murein DD-endopeptidase MepM and murein hydrolase activator NlpD, contain LysM domain [Mesorhizobium australicum]|uniref:Murein DD-endopeptidase MepM and murein hydrolase activator NlpD, contain LysM domain n=1 Tax=Mesorhizobium australicum TaxID=536018 RepID=A0A1X7PCL4_9HYPH|nr:peptidoglycan DD-metalloendopeptidase family protein [Mesorhizobium australicum]SMH48966.1 Murein DD-endopeptidase MepM and murein hydrolase activator NlpD, contain LysM domain [Mesorhizobium australicum]